MLLASAKHRAMHGTTMKNNYLSQNISTATVEKLCSRFVPQENLETFGKGSYSYGDKNLTIL